MSQDDFLKYVSQQVQRYRKEYSLSEGKAFGLWYAVDSLELQEDAAYEAVSYDGANDKDIDFFYIDQESERVLVGQLKFNGKGFIAAPERAIDSIIRFTNSQNPIRLWDLSAQDKLQRRLKKELAALPQPFLYVLRKGEARQLSATERNKFRRGGSGPLRMLSLDLAAQYLAAFRGLPAVAYKDKGRIFSAHYDEVFPDQVRPQEVVLIWQAASVAAGMVKKELELAVQQEAHERVSILKRGAKFFVLAVMAIILHERNGNTFLNKLKAEVAGSKKTGSRLKNYATIALEWYVEAVGETSGPELEISTIVRSQEYWTKIREKIIAKWKVYSLAKRVVEDALPKL
jgi:hypothetical protein